MFPTNLRTRNHQRPTSQHKKQQQHSSATPQPNSKKEQQSKPTNSSNSNKSNLIRSLFVGKTTCYYRTANRRRLSAFQLSKTTRNSLANLLNFVVYSLGGPVLLFYYLISMSMFYQVMGTPNRCPKIKKHAGIKLRSANPANPKAKEPYLPNDVFIYSCESEEYTLTIKCLEDGRWSENPICPDPINFTCPDLGPIDHGYHNATGPPYKVGTVVAFRCQNDLWPGSSVTTPSGANSSTLTTIIPTTTTTTTMTTQSNLMNYASPSYSNLTSNSEIEHQYQQQQQQLTRYNLTGSRLLRCLPSSKWNHPVPSCSPILSEPESNVGLLLTSAVLILIPILILVAIVQLFIRWRKRQEQRERWKQYFTDYKYRHSKTSIAFGMRPQTLNSTTTIPVTDL